MQGGIVVVHLYCSFSMRRQMVPQKTAKFRTACFGQFFHRVRKLYIIRRFGRCFRRLLEDWMCFTNHETFRSSVGRWRYKIRKFAAEIYQKPQNRQQTCAKYFVWLLLR